MAQGISISIPMGWDDRAGKMALARNHGLGLEITAFLGHPGLESGSERRSMERRLARELVDFPGAISLHGAFADLAIHSLDPAIAALSRDRIERDLHTALALGCEKIVFHTGFNPLIPRRCLLGDFLARHRAFWSRLASEYPGIVICLENQWEPDFAILRDLLEAVAHPSVQACIDVAHAHVHSSTAPPDWIDGLRDHVTHLHFNDNLGDEDSHLPIGDGSIDWDAIVRAMNRLPNPPSVVVEVRSFRAISRSLDKLAGLGLHTGDTALTSP